MLLEISMRRCTFALFAVLFVIGPAPAQTPATPPPIDPVFDCFHVNFAWGFRMSGRLTIPAMST